MSEEAEKKTASAVGSSPEIKAALLDLQTHVPPLGKEINGLAYDYQTTRANLLKSVASLYARIFLYVARGAKANQYQDTMSAGTMADMYEYGYVLQEGEVAQINTVIDEIFLDNKLRLLTSMFYEDEFIAAVEKELNSYTNKIIGEAGGAYSITPYESSAESARRSGDTAPLSYETYYDKGATTPADQFAAMEIQTEPGSAGKWPGIKSSLQSGGFLGSGGTTDSFGRASDVGTSYSNNKYVKYWFVGEPIRVLTENKSSNFKNKTFEPKECEAGATTLECHGVFTEEELITIAKGGADPDIFNESIDAVGFRNHGHMHTTFTAGKNHHGDPIYYQTHMNYKWTTAGGNAMDSEVDWSEVYGTRLVDELGGGYGLGSRAQTGQVVTADDLDRLSNKDAQAALVKQIAAEGGLTEQGGGFWKVSEKDIGWGYDGGREVHGGRDEKHQYSTLASEGTHGQKWYGSAGTTSGYLAGQSAEIKSGELEGKEGRTLGAGRLFAEEAHRGNLLLFAGPGVRSDAGRTYLNFRRDDAVSQILEHICDNSAAEKIVSDAWSGTGTSARSLTGHTLTDEKCTGDSPDGKSYVMWNSWGGPRIRNLGEDCGNGSPGSSADAIKCLASMQKAFTEYYDDPSYRGTSPWQDSGTFVTCGIVNEDLAFTIGTTDYVAKAGDGFIFEYTMYWSARHSTMMTQHRFESERQLEITKKIDKMYPYWMCQIVKLFKDDIVGDITKLIDIVFKIGEASDKIRIYYRDFERPIEEIMAGIEFPDGYFEQKAMTLDILFGSDLYDGAAATEELKKEAADADPATISDIDWAKRALYKEQCFLLTFINDIAKAKIEGFEEPKLAASRTASAYGKATAKRLPYVVRNYGTDDKTSQNASVQVRGDPYGFINLLTQSPTQATFFEIPTARLSQLQPKIRLYKIEYDRDADGAAVKGSEREVEVHFDSFAKNLSSVLRTSSRRGEGVGIKSFGFTYDGSNPFAAKKSIKAQLIIFANSFDDLLQERSDSKKRYRYVDLALKTKGSGLASKCRRGPVEENEELSKLNFRLKAVVGWAYPPNDSFIPTQAEKTAIDNSYITLELTPTVHDFAFDQMGRVTFTINYLAYVEDFFDQTPFNIFTDREITKRQYVRKFEFSVLSKKCSGEEIGNIKDSYQDEILKEKKDSVSALIRSLLAAGKVRYINLDYEDVKRFTQKGPWFNYDKFPNGIAGLIQDATDNKNLLQAQIDGALENLKTKAGGSLAADDEGTVASALAVTNPDSENLPFFYLSDLLDIVLSDIGTALVDLPTDIGKIGTRDFQAGSYDSDDTKVLNCIVESESRKLLTYANQFKKLRVVLGPLEITHPENPDLNNFISLGDIPIGIKYFVEWLTDNISKKEETVFPVARFVNQLINGLVRNFMNDDSCFHVSVKQKIRLNQNAITSYPVGDTGTKVRVDEFTQFLATYGDKKDYAASSIHTNQMKKRPFLNISGPKGRSSGRTDQALNYLTYFAGRSNPIERQTGDREYDMKHGIFHYMLGKSKGIVKTIDLTKTDSKGLAEVRFEQDGYDGLKQLRVTYDAKIETYANIQTFPGTYIYIEPRGFAPSMSKKKGDFNLTQYGIGGYYMIIRSTHIFGAGKADTSIEAKWVSQLEAEAESEEQEKRREESGASDLGKCPSARSKRKEQSTEAMTVPEPPGAWEMTKMWWDSL